MLIGYARVSTQDQNLEFQRDALTKAGCQKVFEDKVSGTRADRPGLAKALEMLRDGDTLVVWKLDRLGRSVKQLVDLVGGLHKQSVQFKSLTDAIDTGTPSGRFFFHVMASGAPPTDMAKNLGVSVPTLYRWVPASAHAWAIDHDGRAASGETSDCARSPCTARHAGCRG